MSVLEIVSFASGFPDGAAYGPSASQFHCVRANCARDAQRSALVQSSKYRTARQQSDRHVQAAEAAAAAVAADATADAASATAAPTARNVAAGSDSVRNHRRRSGGRSAVQCLRGEAQLRQQRSATSQRRCRRVVSIGSAGRLQGGHAHVLDARTVPQTLSGLEADRPVDENRW